MTIELATQEDLPQLVAFRYKAYEENGLEQLDCPVDLEKTLYFFSTSIQNGQVIVDRNADNPKLLNGMYSVTLSEPWFSLNHCIISTMFYVKPEHRSFQIAKALVHKAKEYATIKGRPIVFELFTQKDVDRKKKLLKYLGFKDLGSSFVFNPLIME